MLKQTQQAFSVLAWIPSGYIDALKPGCADRGVGLTDDFERSRAGVEAKCSALSRHTYVPRFYYLYSRKKLFSPNISTWQDNVLWEDHCKIHESFYSVCQTCSLIDWLCFSSVLHHGQAPRSSQCFGAAAPWGSALCSRFCLCMAPVNRPVSGQWGQVPPRELSRWMPELLCFIFKLWGMLAINFSILALEPWCSVWHTASVVPPPVFFLSVHNRAPFLFVRGSLSGDGMRWRGDRSHQLGAASLASEEPTRTQEVVPFSESFCSLNPPTRMQRARGGLHINLVAVLCLL